jgi:gas vesicle protein
MRHHHHDDDDDYVVIEKESSSIGPFFIGLLAGAALALLFEPQIKRGARAARRKAGEAVENATDKVADTFESARQKVEERINAVRGAVEEKKDHVERAMRAGQDAARQARNDLEKRLAETKAAYTAGAQVARDVRAEKGRNV